MSGAEGHADVKNARKEKPLTAESAPQAVIDAITVRISQISGILSTTCSVDFQTERFDDRSPKSDIRCKRESEFFVA